MPESGPAPITGRAWVWSPMPLGQKLHRRRWWWWNGRNWLRTLAAAYASGYLMLALWSLVPLVAGWEPAVVVSGSMEPSIRPGDVVFYERTDTKHLTEGRVVLVDDPLRPGELLSHRIYTHNPDHTLILKGDANAAPDSTPIAPANVHGAARLIVPYIGRVTLWNGAHRGLAIASTVLLAISMLFCVDPEARKHPGAPPDGVERRTIPPIAA